jgi:hypothetical protein
MTVVLKCSIISISMRTYRPTYDYFEDPLGLIDPAVSEGIVEQFERYTQEVAPRPDPFYHKLGELATTAIKVVGHAMRYFPLTPMV